MLKGERANAAGPSPHLSPSLVPRANFPQTLNSQVHWERALPLLPHRVDWSHADELYTMSDPSRSVYASAPFKFIVDGEPLYIHADLVSSHSKPLDRMINGHMAEAQKGFATLDDVDTGTFVRFIEWAYKKYYTAAKFITVESPTVKSPTVESPTVESPTVESPTVESPTVESPTVESPTVEFPTVVEEASTAWGSCFDGNQASNGLAIEVEEEFGARSAKNRKSKKGIFSPESLTAPNEREDLMQSFISRRPVERKSAMKVPPPRRNRSSAESYSDVFLSHARLYVFADKYDIQRLKTLALDELHAILAIFNLCPDRTGDIIDLLRYVYAHTDEPRKGVEDMRTLMTKYMGYEMDTLMGDEDFKDLIIEDGGPLLEDFMTMVGRRISSAM